MEVIKPGFEYALLNFNDKTQHQHIQFIRKVNGVAEDGTTNEEVINMMLNRFFFLQEVSFSEENSKVLTLLKEIKELLRKRLERKINNVERRRSHEKVKDPA
jgi:hypothetical protein